MVEFTRFAWVNDVNRQMDAERDARELAAAVTRGLLADNPGPWTIPELKAKVLASEHCLGELAVRRGVLQLLADRELCYLPKSSVRESDSGLAPGSLVVAAPFAPPPD